MQKYHIVFGFLLAFAGNFSRRIPPAACSFIVSGHMVHNITHDIQMMYKICCTKSCEMYEAHSNDIYKGGFRGAHRETPPPPLTFIRFISNEIFYCNIVQVSLRYTIRNIVFKNHMWNTSYFDIHIYRNNNRIWNMKSAPPRFSRGHCPHRNYTSSASLGVREWNHRKSRKGILCHSMSSLCP